VLLEWAAAELTQPDRLCSCPNSGPWPIALDQGIPVVLHIHDHDEGQSFPSIRSSDHLVLRLEPRWIA
jgi:hypothetical protein